MSTEKLMAKETLNLIIDREVVNIPINIRTDFQRKLPDNGSYQIALKAMEQYAAQQVEQQTKQLREERDRAIELLDRWMSINERENNGGLTIFSREGAAVDTRDFLTQLNQNNEG